MKLIPIIQNYMKSNLEIFLKYFFSKLGYHITCYLAKFELKINWYADKKNKSIKATLDQSE